MSFVLTVMPPSWTKGVVLAAQEMEVGERETKAQPGWTDSLLGHSPLPQGLELVDRLYQLHPR